MLARTSLIASLSFAPLVAPAMVVSAWAGPAVAQEAEADLPSGFEVLEKSIKATGGEEAHRKIKSTKLTGTFSMPAQGIEGGITLMRAAPSKMRILVDLGAMGTVDQGTDGTVAWMAQPGAPMQMLQGEPKEAMIENADYYRMLKPREVYKSAETTGVEEVSGEDAYVVKLVDQDGNESTEYYSVETGLRLKEESPEQEVIFSEYTKTKEGIMVPMKMEMTMITPFGEMQQTLTFKEVQQNEGLSDDDFAAPGAN